jgi:hypothetical protein
VQSFDGSGQATQVSSGGGSDPTWSKDARHLYYVKQLGETGVAMMTVEIGSGPALAPGTPHELFRWPRGLACGNVRCFDVAQDGRFLLTEPASTDRPSITRIDLIVNWTATLGNRQ